MTTLSVITFGRWVKRQRQAHTLTQRQLGLLVGCAEDTIRKIEADRRMPSRQVAVLLADVLEIAAAQRDQFLALAHADPAPPLSPAPGPPGLPAAPTPMVGRDADLEALGALLAHQDPRLITLRGVGGVGKTRLALAVAQRIEATTAVAVALIDLGPVSNGDQVLLAIARQRGVSASSEAGVFPALCQHFNATPTLLVLDTFEHLVAAAGMVSALLTACPGLRVLVTSRTALRVRGEYEYVVHPLALPADTDDPAALADNPAVGLFLERVRAIRPRFAVTTANRQALVTLCQRLDGLPLALELAAARCRVLAIEDLLPRLDHRFDGLATPLRDVPARQQSLWATLDWSYDLLDRDTQAMVRALAVFRGSVRLATIAAVGSPEAPDAAAVLVATLLEQSLITVEDHDGALRFGMLDTVRTYARAQWTPEEGVVLARRHAAAMLADAEAFHTAVRAGDAAPLLTGIERAYPDLEAALQWAAHTDPDMLVRLCGALWYAWYLGNQYLDGARWLRAAVAVHAQTDPHTHAALFEGASAIAHSLGDLATAQAMAARCVAVRRQHDPDNRLAAILNNQGLLLMDGGAYAAADAAYRESLGIFEAAQHQLGIATVANNLGVAALLQETWAAAAGWFDRAEHIARALGDQIGLVNVLDNRLKLALQAGDRTQTAALMRELCRLPDHLPGHYGAIEVAEAAAAALVQDDPGTARQLWAWAQAERARTGVARLPSDDRLLPAMIRAQLQTGQPLEEAMVPSWSVANCMALVERHFA